MSYYLNNVYLTKLYFFTQHDGCALHPIEFNECSNDKEFIFKVQFRCDDIKQLEPSFIVVDVCHDPLVVSKFKESNPSILPQEVCECLLILLQVLVQFYFSVKSYTNSQELIFNF